MKRSYLRRLINKWTVMGAAAVCVVGSVVWASAGNGKPAFDDAVVTVGDVVERVSVTGTISPMDKADLAFKRGGVVETVSVKVGDLVRRGDRLAAMDNASEYAAYLSAQATLADMSRSLSAEEYSVQRTALDNARYDAVNAARAGLVKAQSAVYNYTDTFFLNAQSVNPTITVYTRTSTEEKAINDARLNVTESFAAWTAALDKSSDAMTALNASRDGLSQVKTFMSMMSMIIGNLSAGNSGLTQSQIASYTATMNTAASTLNSAIDAVAAARAALAAAQSNYDLKVAGNSPESIAAQSAKVAQAKAALDDTILLAPIDGIVTRVVPQKGEFVAAGADAVSIQNDYYKIEAYVPESDIAKVSIGNKASTTLDAYGSATDFPAVVTMIDPAETVLEGVPTYKVTLVFVSSDPRIRSGMTANLEIHTRAERGVVMVPYRAVVDISGVRSARIVNTAGDGYTAVPVTTGLKGSDGMIEIVSGLSAGDRVVTYIK